ncbi:MAG TPA: response regulator transcription factor [Gaiellaceae bacterium]|nr:response regulator transcription factor [Gaiellaceae bacterium]
MTRILVAEDEPAILDAVAYTLRGEGYEVETVEDGEKVLAHAHHDEFDLLILDLMLPKLSGIEVLRRVRSTSALPVIVLTARAAEADRVLGLEIGADDYVTKPFSMAELLSRVRAILRRRELDRGSPNGPIRVGGLELDPYRHRVVVDGDPRHVTRSEFKLLALLASEPERPFSRRELMQHLWESDYVGDQRACDIHISNLRRKVERDPTRPERIATVRGVGYKLVPV